MESSGMPRPCHCPCKPQNATARAELGWRTRVRRCFLKNKHLLTFPLMKHSKPVLAKRKKLVSFLEAILAKSQLCESLFLWGFEVARPVRTMERMDTNHDPNFTHYFMSLHMMLFHLLPIWKMEISRVNCVCTYMIRAVRVVAAGESSKSSPVAKAHISFHEIHEHVSHDELFGLLEAKENLWKSQISNPQYNRFQQPLAKPSKWHSSWQRLGTASKARLETRNRSDSWELIISAFIKIAFIMVFEILLWTS